MKKLKLKPLVIPCNPSKTIGLKSIPIKILKLLTNDASYKMTEHSILSFPRYFRINANN